MLEHFKKTVDKGNEFGGLLTKISKAFDHVDHKLSQLPNYFGMESHIYHLI